jgi:hypothetical protein
MFSLNKIFIFGSIAILSISILIIGVAGTTEPTPAPWPTLALATTPDKTTSDTLKELAGRYYDVRGEAARTFDVTAFPTVFVDDPTVSLDKWQIEIMAKAKVSSGGMLTFELVFYGTWKAGADKLAQVAANAKAQGRELNANDIAEANAVSSMAAPPRTGPVFRPPLTFNNISVSGKQAIIEFDDAGQTLKFFCVNTKDGWRIAGMRVLSTHI